MTRQVAKISLVKVISILMFFSLMNITTTFAASQGDASLQNNAMQQAKEDQLILKQKAKMWGLTTDDYQQYLKEMANTPASYWWKNIDPPQVLGMNAKTKVERMKYARIDVQLDQERTSREIAFQHAYSKAFAELYPKAKNIDINVNQHNSNTLLSGDRFYLFTKIDDSEGALLANKIIDRIHKESNVELNIFFVGQASFAAIQHWAISNNIPKVMHHGDLVTLNHNKNGSNNMLQQVLKTTKAVLPVLVRVRDDRSEIMALTSL